ncbi:hypothetical protein Tco_1357498 [Tanacetum coccineum]
MITEFAAAHSFFKKSDACLIIFTVGTTTLRLTICCYAEDSLGRSCTTKMEIKPRILWMNLYGEATMVLRTRVTEGVATEVEGTLRTHIGRRKSWWLSDEVIYNLKAKQTRFRELMSMRSEDQANKITAKKRYKEAKQEVKKAVTRAKGKVYEDLYKRLDSK